MIKFDWIFTELPDLTELNTEAAAHGWSLEQLVWNVRKYFRKKPVEEA